MVFGVVMVLVCYLEIVVVIKVVDYDVVSYGWCWIYYQYMDIVEECEYLYKVVQVLIDLFGKLFIGWYIGCDSFNICQLVVEYGGFDYDSDYYGDDLFFWSEVVCSDGSQWLYLIVFYIFDVNDMCFVIVQGFNIVEQFYIYLKDSFDVLYVEGEIVLKMMFVGMYC